MSRLTSRALACATASCAMFAVAVVPAHAAASGSASRSARHPAATGGGSVAVSTDAGRTGSTHAGSAHTGTTRTGSTHTGAATRAAARGRARNLREGMHGPAVRVLQRRLRAAGFRTSVDGQFGPATLASVQRFQRAEGWRTTGIVNPSEMRTLLAAGAARASATATADSPAATATINANGTLTLPAGAPAPVQGIVAAANRIIDTSYVWGGGHGSFTSTGYDCSGAVSYALHGGGLLTSPEDSSGLESFGMPGPGAWVSVYANAGHTWIEVAGRAFDTADFGGPDIPAGSGPRWRTDPTGNLADHTSYVVRHPAGL